MYVVEVQRGAEHVLKTMSIKQDAKNTHLLEDNDPLYKMGEMAAGVHRDCGGDFERPSNLYFS